MEANYTKRELDKEFEHIKNALEKQDDVLNKILTQATATNGRVNKFASWKSYIMGGLATVGIIGLPVLWLMAREVIDNSRTLTSHIAQDKDSFDKLNVNN